MGRQRERPRITLDQLRAFLTVAEIRHQARAAEALNLSPAAVSEKLRLLERALGIALFERTGRVRRLTEPAQALRQAAAAAIDAAHTVEEIAVAHRGLEQGRVSVVAGHTIGQYRLPNWLVGFAGRHPRLEVSVKLQYLAAAVQDLTAGSVECAIIGGSPPHGAFEVMLIERHELVIAVAHHHPLAASADPLNELDQHKYLMRGEGSGTERAARSLLGSAYGVGPVQQLGLGSVPVALLAGLGYAVMPKFAIEEWVAHKQVVILRSPRRPVFQSFYALRRHGPNSPALDAFWEYLRDVVRAPT